METKILKLIWYAFPVTKAVYVYLALSRFIPADNGDSDAASLVFLALGLLSAGAGIMLSTKVYNNRNLFENPLIKRIYARTVIGLSVEDAKRAVFFNVFTLLLGFGETAALLGLVQYLFTGNQYVFIALLVACAAVWVFNYPKTAILDKEF